MKRVALLITALVLASPAAAHENSCPVGGSDGQRVAASAGALSPDHVAGKIPSPSFQQDAFWLCCNRSSGTCSDKDTGGAVDAYIFSLESLGTCTAVDVSVGFRNEASGVFQTVGNLTLGVTSIVVPRPANRRIAAVVNTMTGCAGGGEFADVRVDVLKERKAGQ